MVPFAAKFGHKDIDESDFDWIGEAYARYFGHDPSGNWILVVYADNESEIFRFDDIDEMWCCRPDRERFYDARRGARFIEAFKRPSD
jgi:hypothetical protein